MAELGTPALDTLVAVGTHADGCASFNQHRGGMYDDPCDCEVEAARAELAAIKAERERLLAKATLGQEIADFLEPGVPCSWDLVGWKKRWEASRG